jgi:hypothetical protein
MFIGGRALSPPLALSNSQEIEEGKVRETALAMVPVVHLMSDAEIDF